MYSVALVSERISDVRMVGVGVDSMSRAAEFSVAPSIFWHLNREAGFGRGGAFKGYTVDMYASKKTRKCRKYAIRGGGDVFIEDARTLVLRCEDNSWVCPPLPVIPTVVI